MSQCDCQSDNVFWKKKENKASPCYISHWDTINKGRSFETDQFSKGRVLGKRKMATRAAVI